MQTTLLLRKISLFFAFSMFVTALCLPDQRFGGPAPLHAEDDEEMEYEDDDEMEYDFDDEDLEDLSPRERRQYIREETQGMRLGEKLEFLNQFNQALQEQRDESFREQQFERDEERWGRLFDQGRISEDEYNRRVDQAAERLGIEDPEYSSGGYEEGWEGREQYFHSNSTNWNTEQKALNIDYVKHGDRPLEADEGFTPKPNPLLGAPAAYDGASSTRLSTAILEGLKDDVVGLASSLPPGCRIEDAQTIINQKREAGEQLPIVEQLQAALIDRDVRRFERNAEALGIPANEIQSLLIGMTFKNLQDHLEDNASIEEIRKITEPMVRRVDQAGLDADLAVGLANWLKSIPDLMKIQSQLASGKTATPAWPAGESTVIFDPRYSDADAKILPEGTLVASAEGEARITVGVGNKYTASGIPVLKGAPANIPAQGAKPETPSLLLAYPEETGDPLKYTITCFMDVPTQVADQFQPQEAWKQEYSIKPGLKQKLPLAWNGRIWYLISCPSRDGSGQPKQYSLKPESGVSPDYAFRVDGNAVTVVSTSSKVVLDNSANSRPFHYMEGNRYAHVRAGGKEEFDSGVTIRYARNGNTTPPKDVNGQPIAGAAPIASDISTITLRSGENGVIGVNSNGDWEIRQGGDLLLAERNEVKLPVIKFAGKKTSDSPSSTETSETNSSVRGTLYILAVGISKYQNPKQFPQLSFADKDVGAIAGILQKQENTVFKTVAPPKILLNEKATAISIRTELKGLEKKATKNDTVALIFSGHGMLEKNEYYFCPYNTDQTKIARQGISCEELQKVTDELSARNVFVFLDSCYSGGATEKIQKTFENKVGKVGNSGVVIFASSKGSESSQEDPSWGHGALTKAFIDTVSNPDLDQNNDSLIQVVELDAGLTEGVKQLTGGGQHVQSAEFGASILNLPVARFNNN